MANIIARDDVFQFVNQAMILVHPRLPKNGTIRAGMNDL
jgi:hypothetical protein